MSEPQFDPARFEIRPLFPTPVAIAPVADAETLNAELGAIILARAEAAEGVLRSNDGGWQSNDDFAAWSGAAGTRLTALATELANSLTAVQTDSEFIRKPPVWKINAWANVNRTGDANKMHHHPAAFWSAVYWVDAGDEKSGGEFEASDPRGVLPAFYAPRVKYDIPGCLSAGGSDFIVPKTGTMLLFPAWLEHAVRPYRGTRPRISVALNFCI